MAIWKQAEQGEAMHMSASVTTACKVTGGPVVSATEDAAAVEKPVAGGGCRGGAEFQCPTGVMFMEDLNSYIIKIH